MRHGAIRGLARRFEPSGVSYDAAVVAWAAAVVTAGGTVSATEKGYVNTLVGSLKSGGVWAKLDALFLFAAENSQQAGIDIVNLVAGTNHGATFTADQGWAGNGSTTYFDSGFNLSTGTHFTRNDAHFSEWRRTTAGGGGTHSSGAIDGGATNGTYLSTQSDKVQLNGAFGSNELSLTGGVTEVGHLLMTRTSSTAVASYLNGASAATGSADTSFAGLNETYWIGGRNFGGSINQAHNAQSLALTFGASLTSGQITTLYNALNAYKTSVGA